VKYALVVASAEYNDPKLSRLKTPAADSRALAQILRNQDIGGFDHVTTLVNQTEAKVRRSISEFFSNKKPDDLVLAYFTGHGVLDDRGRLYLAFKDTRRNLLKGTAIPSAFLADEMDGCRSKRQILVLDCCNSGAFERGTKGEQRALTQTTFEGNGFGRVVLTASDSTQYALEGDQVITQTELSLFTHFLLDGLRTGRADLNADGLVTLDEWYEYTYTQVVSETSRQVPHKWSYRQQGELVIARNPFLKEEAERLPDELVRGLKSPFSGVREGALKELGRLLDSGDSEIAALVRAVLGGVAERDDSPAISAMAARYLSGQTGSSEESQRASGIGEQAVAPPLPISTRAEASPDSKALVLRVPLASARAAAEVRPQRRLSIQLVISITALAAVTLIVGVPLLVTSMGGAPPTTRGQATGTFQGAAGLPVVESPTSATATEAAQPGVTATSAPEVTAPASLGVGSTQTRDSDGMPMVYVPAGAFPMGYEEGGPDERPVHDVNLDAYWIDRTEVSNAMYARCADAGQCRNPGSSDRTSSPDKPVTYVSWIDAQTYCTWAEARLPTEAEWEKAARGTDGRIYPWGNVMDPTRIFRALSTEAVSVNDYPLGASPYGALQMAGNVYEFVADWYSDTYYSASPDSNPLGPSTGRGHVVRGGFDSGYRTTGRIGDDAVREHFRIGIRCAVGSAP
jgi:formylglycine-generating enzyme required for sulfatase activity